MMSQPPQTVVVQQQQQHDDKKGKFGKIGGQVSPNPVARRKALKGHSWATLR
jgi:hypothetical protein